VVVSEQRNSAIKDAIGWFLKLDIEEPRYEETKRVFSAVQSRLGEWKTIRSQNMMQALVGQRSGGLAFNGSVSKAREEKDSEPHQEREAPDLGLVGGGSATAETNRFADRCGGHNLKNSTPIPPGPPKPDPWPPKPDPIPPLPPDPTPRPPVPIPVPRAWTVVPGDIGRAIQGTVSTSGAQPTTPATH